MLKDESFQTVEGYIMQHHWPEKMKNVSGSYGLKVKLPSWMVSASTK
jgi:hypothetical protein